MLGSSSTNIRLTLHPGPKSRTVAERRKRLWHNIRAFNQGADAVRVLYKPESVSVSVFTSRAIFFSHDGESSPWYEDCRPRVVAVELAQAPVSFPAVPRLHHAG